MRARALAEISVVTFFRRHAENLPARFEGCAHARRGERRVTDHADYFLELRARPGQVAAHLDVESARLPCLCIEQMHIARLFVDDRVGAGGGVHHVKVVVTSKLSELLRIRAVSKEVDHVIAIREEVDRVADPHRIGVVTVGPGKFLDGMIGKSHYSDRMGAAASVVPPIAGLVPSRNERRRKFFVGDAAAIGRVSATESARHRQRLGQTAVQSYGPKPEVCCRRADPARPEEHATAIGRPAAHPVRPGMVR